MSCKRGAFIDSERPLCLFTDRVSLQTCSQTQVQLIAPLSQTCLHQKLASWNDKRTEVFDV